MGPRSDERGNQWSQATPIRVRSPSMGPRSDERGNSGYRNPLVVKELQTTARAIQSPAENSPLFVNILGRKTYVLLLLALSSGLARIFITWSLASACITCPACCATSCPLSAPLTRNSVVQLIESRTPGIPQSRLPEREPAVSLGFQATAYSLHGTQKAGGSQANPFAVHTNERMLSAPTH